MIKLKDIIKEIQEPPAEYVEAWQKPDGKLLPVKYSHPSDAINYIGGDPRADAVVVLWKRGWNRITSGMMKDCKKVLYSQNEFSQPNDRQKAELINTAKENNFDEVVYTSSDDGKARILWSKHDVLQEEEEPTKERKSTSWLDSGGRFIPMMGSHHSFAMRITGNALNPEEVLWKKGWQRVTYYSRGTLYVENHIMPPNDIQRRKLTDLVKELNFDVLKYDNGKDRDIILWSKEDFLEQAK